VPAAPAASRVRREASLPPNFAFILRDFLQQLFSDKHKTAQDNYPVRAVTGRRIRSSEIERRVSFGDPRSRIPVGIRSHYPVL
jgi:hypothetical protein